MVKKSIEIHSENILPIIKKWLYSDKEIFLRELVSNACDALKKLELLSSQGVVSFQGVDGKVEVTVDPKAKTLTIQDNGIGMDAEEVQKYIAQIAFSGAEEFLSKYQEHSGEETFIGHFGLGFYSAYMVADKVEIDTLSYKEGAKPVFWSCDGSSEYLLDEGKRTSRGTTITLHIGSQNDEFLEPSRIRQILHHYCDFLPFGIFFGESKINTHEPLWIKPVHACEKKDYLAFWRYLYPMEEDPLFWVHLSVDYPFHLKGILFFPKIKRDYDPSQSSVKLYCNRVFVSDSCKDVIPNYLMMLKGVIDSPDIPLNVSRSYLQMDRTVKQLSSHISKKIADQLLTLYRQERERFLEVWDDVSLVVKLGILEDEKFYERVKECLVWKTIDGEWMTVEEYLEAVKDKAKDKIFYVRDPKESFATLQIYRDKKIPVLCSSQPIDTYLMHFLENKLMPVKFQRIDAAVDDHMLDKSKEKMVLDASGRTESAYLADFFRAKLSHRNFAVEAKSLASEDLPGLIVFGEQERRMRDYLSTIDPKGKEKGELKGTFVVNTNHPLMQHLKELEAIDSELAKDLVEQTFELALLSQREMDPEHLNQFIALSHKVLKKVTTLALEKHVI